MNVIYQALGSPTLATAVLLAALLWAAITIVGWVIDWRTPDADVAALVGRLDDLYTMLDERLDDAGNRADEQLDELRGIRGGAQ